jgi:hypothetical protein
MGLAIVTAILLLWFLLSVVNQLPLDFSSTLRSRDVFKLVPRWIFFAPNPFDADLSIIYRTKDLEGRTQIWQEVAWIKPRRFTDCIWNPMRRRPKSLVDLLEYMRSIAGDDPMALQHTSAYLTILEIVAGHHRRHSQRDAAFIQFAILRSCMFEPLLATTLLMRSKFHAVSPCR